MECARSFVRQLVSQFLRLWRRGLAPLCGAAAVSSSLHAAVLNANFTSAGSFGISTNGYVATGNTVNLSLAYTPVPGAKLTVVHNFGNTNIQGRFGNLAHGQIVNLSHNGLTHKFIANYFGGTGNDLVLEWYRRSVIAWGANANGQLGNGTNSSSLVPIEIANAGALSGKTVVAVSAGTDGHSLALCLDGTVVAWGNNNHGQLGDGTTLNRSAPVPVTRSGALAGKFVIAIGTGANHSLALCSDGTLVSWGRNHKGQLGNGSFASSSVAVVVSRSGVLAGELPIMISSEASQNMVLCASGAVASWGDNANGQLGNGSTAASSNLPVLLTRSGVLSGKKITSISMGGGHGLAVSSDGTLASWGANAFGQLGNNSLTLSRTPVLVHRAGTLSGKVVIAMDAGHTHNLVHCSDGTLAAWGSGANGQLGNNSSTDSKVPVLVTRGSALTGRIVTSVSAGTSFSFVTCSDGTAATWGNNSSGQLGNNSTVLQRIPVLVDRSGILSDHRAGPASAGSSHSLTLAADPSSSALSGLIVENATITPTFAPAVLAYGTRLPIGTNQITIRPTLRSRNATLAINGTSVASGAAIAIPFFQGSAPAQIVVTAESGAKSTYTLSPPTGLNGTFASPTTVAASAPLYDPQGKDLNLLLQFKPTPGTRLLVVNNSSLALMNGRFENLAHGQQVVLPYNGLNYRFIANYYGGSGNDLVLEWADRYAYAWGSNFSGQLGTSQSSTSISRIPLEVNRSGVLAGKTIFRIIAGDAHTLALCSDNTLVSWGANASGQLGNGTTNNSALPVLVSIPQEMLGKTIVDIEAGNSTSLALCSDGSLFAWGANNLGQLGNGTTTNSSVPKEVDRTGALAGKQVIAISAGGSHQLVLTDGGELFAWGSNAFGQLGNGNNTDSFVPVKVVSNGILSGNFVVSISAGTSHSLALCLNRTIVSWGRGSDGRLGNGSLFNRNIPGQVYPFGVLSNKGINKVAAGDAHSLALCADGTVAAWGLNTSGQLGDGTLVYRIEPVAVNQSGAMSGKVPLQVDAGANHAIVKCSDGSAFGWGNNSFGQLGSASTISFVSSPVRVADIGSPVPSVLSDLSAGREFTVALAAAQASSDSGLSALAFNAGTLDFAFSPARTAYHCAVPRTLSSISLAPTVRQPWARIKVNGVDLASGTSTSPIPLTNSATLISILVTAEDGTSTTYTVNVVKSENIAAAFQSPTSIPATHPAFDATGLSVTPTLAFAPSVGTSLTLLKITGLNLIEGRFANLAHGQEIKLPFNGMNYLFIVNYYGGSGNDLVLEWGRRGLAGWGATKEGLMRTPSGQSVLSPIAVPQRGALEGKKILKLSPIAALCSDGTIATWGDDSYGQLGNGFGSGGDAPVAVNMSGVLSGKTVISVKSRSDYCIALCSDGTLASWGYNRFGSLGDGTTQNRNAPVLVTHTGALAGKKVVAIDLDGYHCLALCSDGSLMTWGSDAGGALGTGTFNSAGYSSVPVAVNTSGVLAGRTAVKIAAGYSHNLALCSNGAMVTWGGNSFGQLGNGSSTSRNLPVEVVSSGALAGKVIDAVGARGESSYALCSDGTVVTWGAGVYGQLGNGTSANSLVPVAIASNGALSGKFVSAISSGGSHMVATCTDGSLVSWGENAYGQLGNGNVLNSNVPLPVDQSGYLAGKRVISLDVLPGQSIAQVSVPANSRLASLTTLTGVFTTDFDPAVTSYQYLGPASATHIRVIPTRESDQAVIRINGITVTSGTPSPPIPFSSGSLPVEIVVTAEDGSTTTYTILPPPTFAASFSSASDVPLNVLRAVADGWPLALTLNFAPDTGTNLMVMNVQEPEFIQGEFQNLPQGQIVELPYNGRIYRFAVNYHGGTGNDLVLEWANRSLASWGGSFAGATGDGTEVNGVIPVAVERSGALAGRTVVSISASSFHTLALCADGTLLGWGSNQFGVLGLGEVPSSLVPAVLNRGALAGKKVIAAHTGSIFNLALCSDGTLAAWGGGSILKFATGSTADIIVPTEVPKLGALAGKNVVAVSVGAGHFLVLCSDGTLVSWGDNRYAQMGSGGAGGMDDALPVKVVDTGALAGKKVISIGTGYRFSAALCSDGEVAVWGGYLAGSEPYYTPRLLSVDALPNSFVKTFAVSSGNIAYLTANGTMGTSGDGFSGQIGNNSDRNQTHAVPIANYGAMVGRTVRSFGVGNQCMFAITTDNQILGWGSNSGGRLGVGGTSDVWVPRIVEPNSELYGTVPLAVASGGVAHTHAILALPDNGYANWMTGRPGLTNKTENGDPDRDGIPNLLEYVFGSNPAAASLTSLPVSSISGNNFVFKFDRRFDSIHDTDQIFQYSPDLVNWTDVPLTAPLGAGVNVGSPDTNGNQSVEIAVPKGTHPQIFGRLKVLPR